MFWFAPITAETFRFLLQCKCFKLTAFTKISPLFFKRKQNLCWNSVFNVISLILYRLYRIRKDYLNVSNVDLYYTNNSQMYVGLFRFFIHFWYCEKNLSFGNIKTKPFWQSNVWCLSFLIWHSLNGSEHLQRCSGKRDADSFDPHSVPYRLPSTWRGWCVSRTELLVFHF